ncbi:MAG: sialate O-acetylesterase [Bacteroidales bacterium]|nr:sialate O-acetylesterase [Bacteroidales bacterium]
MKYSTYLFLLILCFVLPEKAEAKLRLPAFISSNMVLQQKQEIKLWGWSDPDIQIKIKASWSNKQVKIRTNPEGYWESKLNTPAAGGPYTILLDDGEKLLLENILIGELWFCSGQSNMEMPLKGYPAQGIEGSLQDILQSEDEQLRLFTVKRAALASEAKDVQGQWQEASPQTTANFSATAYYFGRYLRELLGVPVGLINSSLGGSFIEAWMSAESLKGLSDLPVPLTQEEVRSSNRTATALYNGMVHPFLGINIKGCIWYQGESNTDRPESFKELFVQMVSSWRKEWGIGEFPFYYCQIAPYDYSLIRSKGEKVVNSALIREAQAQAEDLIPNCGMAVLMDAGLISDIHPRKKQQAGERLAVLALSGTYGLKDPEFRSPRYALCEQRDSVLVLSFDRAGLGLDRTTGSLKHFWIAGRDKVFYPAQAKINRDKIQLWSASVPQPVAARYAFDNCSEGDLFGVNGQPVSSFRTDNWTENEIKILSKHEE